jgi:hypothetical protein
MRAAAIQRRTILARPGLPAASRARTTTECSPGGRFGRRRVKVSRRLSVMPSSAGRRRQGVALRENSTRRRGEAESSAVMRRTMVSPSRVAGAMVTVGGRLVDNDGGADEFGFAGIGGGIGEAVAGDDAEEVAAVGEGFGFLDVGGFGEVVLEEFPLAFIAGAVVEGVDELVLVGVFGGPGDVELGLA